MILVVALNPALDVTYHVPGVNWSGVNRPRQVLVRPGGKGLNVARTLQALGSDTLVIGLAGGVTGDAVRAGLADAGVPARFVSIAGETRRTFAVVDTARHETALFNEPGGPVSAGEWAALIVMYEKSLTGSSAVVLSGSLPPGLAADSYAGLAARAASATRCRRCWTPRGPRCYAARPGARRSSSRTSPNWNAPWAGPCPGATWPPPRRPPENCGPRGRARWWCRSAAMACSRLPATAPGTRRRRSRWPGTRRARGTPSVAGLAHGLALGTPWPERLRQAAALGTAAVAAPAAGQFDPADYARALAGVSVARWTEG